MNTGSTIVPRRSSGCFSDRAADRLDDVDRRAAWVDEGDPVYGRHVDALAETAGVAQ